MADNLVYNIRELGYSQILKYNMDLAKTVIGKDFIVDILSNITVNPAKEVLELSIRSLSLNPVIRFGNYDNIVQDSFSIGETDLVIVFYELINLSENFHLQAELLNEIEVQEVIGKCKRDIDILFKNLSGKPLVLFNSFSSYPLTSIVQSKRNLEIIEKALNSYIHETKPGNVQLIDTDRILASVGIKEALDKKKFSKYKSLYKIDFLKAYVAAIENHLLRRTGRLKKALIFDCDNTLWKGVIGEDGPDGIDMSAKSETGIYYHLVQKIALGLSGKGVLICLCSKNNPAEVEGILGKHPDMLLNKEQIVSMKVNWNNKDENLKALAKELNIGLNSFVFVDDSAFEVNLIKNSLPEVVVVTVPKDVTEYPAMVLEVAQRYFNLEPLKEDLSKVKSYKEQARRTETLNTIG
ncbi:MAG: HAD-IIIC family phosphatase, partial [Sphingobacteriales bacterium]